mgnify:CR=1 FL=1
MSSATTINNPPFLAELARLVGSSHLLTDPAKTQRYRKGFRSGHGDALAVVFPVPCLNYGECSAPASRLTKLS